MSDNIQQIKERLNIIDVISGYLRLQKAGVNYKGLCPFHNEKTPSFMVSPSRQTWHCFGCGEGGDIFTFVEKIENIEFVEALKILAEKAGIELARGDPKLRSEKDRIYEICEKAAQFFSLTLNNANDANGDMRMTRIANGVNENLILDYLHKRGLNDKTIEEWRVGYAPDSWDSLLLFLNKKGYREQEIEKAGLVIQAPSSKLQAPRYHDRFRNRLMFPIFDASGRVVAFSGRTMADVIPSKTEKADSGKYINSPETILFTKSRILYGFDRAKHDIRKADRAVLVEGQMDVLLPWQDGIKNIIATSGTSLTEDHLTILKRLTSNLVLAFDMDDAGFRATKRGIDMALNTGFNISVLSLESGKDPADFVKESPGELAGRINSAEPIMSYYFRQVFGRFDGEKMEGKKFIAAALLSEIKKIPSAIERSSWIRELGLKLQVAERDLQDEMENITAEAGWTPGDKTMAPSTKPSRTRREILSERLLALLLKEPGLIGEAAKILPFLPQRDLEILTALASSKDNFSSARTALTADLRPVLDFLYLAADYETEKMGSGANIVSEIGALILEIEKENYREALAKINQAIKRHELNFNNAESGKNLETLTKEFQNISNKLNNLSKKQDEKKI